MVVEFRVRGTMMLSRVAGISIAVFAILALSQTPAAARYKLTALHLFCQERNCTDGAVPLAPLLRDRSGTLYGTTSRGGAFNDAGTVFAMIPNGTGYDYQVVYSFCQQVSCADGADPESAVITDVDGSLYGTTRQGGANGLGVLFKLTPNGGEWGYQALYSFCANAECKDGKYPQAALSYSGQGTGAPWDKSSPLFGTASQGGKYGNGVVFELNPTGAGFAYTSIYHPRTEEFPNTTQVDSAGNVLISAILGAKRGAGSLFQLANGTWKKSNVRVFCHKQQGIVCLDGFAPFGQLLRDAQGNLFGTTISGGAGNLGVAYELSAAGRYKVLFEFCPTQICTDTGANPQAGVVMDAAGHLFGTTGSGGTAMRGLAYELSHDSGRWQESVIYDFCSERRCRDGNDPIGEMLIDESGSLIGITEAGGLKDHGVVFALTPH
jgi:uncharacterized repeat protein (TIGR03803 family)